MKAADKLQLLFLLGWRNLYRQKRRTFLVMSAASVGMLGVIVNISLMNGLSRMWVEGAIESGLGHVQIRPEGYRENRKSKMIFAEPEKISRLVSSAKLPAGTAVSFRLERAGFLRLGTHLQGVSLMGVEPESEKKISRFQDWIIRGKFLSAAGDDPEELPECLLGEANARKFEVDIDDTIVISLGSASSEAVSVRARVVGIFRSIAEPIDKFTVLIHRNTLSHLYDGGENGISYAVFLTGQRKQADALGEVLRKIPGLEKQSDILSYQELQPGITQLMQMMDSMIYLIYGIMLLGFAFVLLNTVLMSIFERTRELGIVRALGASEGFLFLMIILESMIMGLAGCLAGLAIGSLLVGILNQTGVSFAMFSKGMELMGAAGSLIHPSLTLRDITTGIYVSIFITFIASLYPAWRAVKLSPVQAIYHR